MPTYDVGEMWDSRSGSRGGDAGEELLIYDVLGFEDGDGPPTEAGARAAVIAEAPTIAGLYRGAVRHRQRGGYRWLIEVEYSTKPKDPEKVQFEWDISSVNVIRKLSLATLNVYTATGFSGVITSSTYRGGINVTKDGVQGTEVPVGEGKFTLTRWFKPYQLTPTFFTTAHALVGFTNNAEFYGLPAGTLLFDGLTARCIYDVTTDPEDQEPVEVPGRFRYSPNVSGQTVHGITGVAKNGWDFNWPAFVDDVDSTANMLVQKPAAIIRDKVVEAADYSLIGLGTAFP